MCIRDRLRANILRAISHDLRTPLTSISGNASNLVSNSESFTEEMKQAIYKDIYEDSMWLIDLVENLLAISKIDEGRLNIQKSSELMDEMCIRDRSGAGYFWLWQCSKPGDCARLDCR